ncbi:hypothetical protein DRO54_05220 [Candidatus Bathyarchaeota archaeon]|nr:MAG: hypothetical protein DRO54_05220 [Candidatus Bathyarchaeota archaeon]
MRKKVKCPNCGMVFVPLRPSEMKILNLLKNRKMKFSELKAETHLSSPALSEALKFLLSSEIIRKNGQYYEVIT